MVTIRSIRTRAAWVLASVLLLAGTLCAASRAVAQTEFLEPTQAFKGHARVVDPQALEVRIDVTPAYHLYRERMSVELAGGGAQLGKIVLPSGTQEYDETFQKNFEVLRGAVIVPIPVTELASDFKVKVTYQGCADKGLCYPPQTGAVWAGVQGGKLVSASWHDEDDSAAAPPMAADTSAAPAAPDSRVTSALKSGSLLTIAGVFLVAGLLLAFTPCVLPMVPILSAIIVGQGVPATRARGFALALTYALGMALIYTALGVVAGLLGEGLAAALQNPWVLGAFALALATMSLSMFGVFELQMPGFIQSRLAETSGRLPGGRYAGVFLMGGLSALIVGPCVAAPLAGALVFISQTRNVVIGGLALFSLAMGMSVPLLLVGVSAGSLLPRAGAWMNGVKAFFGVLLLGVAVWMVAPVLPGWATMLLIGAVLIVAAASLRPFASASSGLATRRRMVQGAAVLLAALGVTQIVGAVSGGTDPLQPLRHLSHDGGAQGAVHTVFQRVRDVGELDAALRTAGRPVMLDFYADWCVSCKEMELLTLRDPAVRARLSHALLLQADVTANSAADQALLKRFGLFGPPGILFFDPQGQEQSVARVIGFLSVEPFGQSLTHAGL